MNVLMKTLRSRSVHLLLSYPQGLEGKNIIILNIATLAQSVQIFALGSEKNYHIICHLGTVFKLVQKINY